MLLWMEDITQGIIEKGKMGEEIRQLNLQVEQIVHQCDVRQRSVGDDDHTGEAIYLANEQRLKYIQWWEGPKFNLS